MAKPSSPRHLATLVDRLAPALRRMQGTGAARGARVGVLAHLTEAGAVPMKALAAHLSVSPQAVTGLVDEMEAEGLVTRERHPTDRRRTMIRLNDHARALALAQVALRETALTALFDGIPKPDRAAFARVAEALLERLDRPSAGQADGSAVVRR